MTDPEKPRDLAPDESRGDQVDSGGLPEHEWQRLVATVTGRSLSEVRGEVDLSPAQRDRVEALAYRRLHGEPLQYLEGTVRFGPVELAVDERVLIPRPETEYLFDLISDLAISPRLIVDLCTGSGALALALKHRFLSARVIGTDVSAPALDLARSNAAANGLSIEFRLGDLFAALPDELLGSVDLLIANPPYVAELEWDQLPDDVKMEPRFALIGGPSGSEIIEVILGKVREWISPDGQAWVEIGDGQAASLRRKFAVEVVLDQYRHERFVRLSARPDTNS